MNPSKNSQCKNAIITGLGTVNVYRQLLGLEEVKWGDGYLVTDDLAGEDDVLIEA
jgi:hypothetical protein